jgi:TPP-dependent pyruvate/acetoin dehydrogenase alpha subunit
MVTSKHHWEDEMATRKSATAASRKKPAEKSGLNGGITEFDKETELEAYREMLLIRRFEEKAGQLYGMGFIGGFCHLYIGQEAVVVGMQMALKDGDQVITGYRDHGHMLATGMEARGVMAELTGRQGGYSRARAARCTCSPRTRTSTAATASSAPRCRSAPVWPSPTSIASNGNVS